MITDAEIKAARALCEDHTFDMEERAVDMPFAPYHESAAAWWYVRATDGTRPVACKNEEDALFYVAARDLVPRLLDEVERLRASDADTMRAFEGAVEGRAAFRAELKRVRPIWDVVQLWFKVHGENPGIHPHPRCRDIDSQLMRAVDAALAKETT